MRCAIALVLAVSLNLSASGQDFAKKQLEKSSRHGEWVKVKRGAREVSAWVVYPEIKEKAPVVLVIHEIFGLSDWVRSLADQLAEAGYIAIAPDLLSGMAPKGGGTAEFESGALGRAIRDLKPGQIDADLDACADYGIKLPACNGKLAVCGFCWGGGETFRYATHRKDLKAAFVFYGAWRDETKDALAKIPCPVYGFYGENDMRVNATIEKSQATMKELGKTYEPVIYSGGRHGFMRMGDDPTGNEGNKKARAEAWKRWKELLKKI